MAEKIRTCPACGAQLRFRLGMLECAECGHTEPLERPEPAPEESPRAAARRKLPLWVPPVTTYVEPPGKIFVPGEYDEHARVSTSFVGRAAELYVPKLIALALMVVQAALGVLLILPQRELMGLVLGPAYLGTGLFCGLLGIVLWAYAFFTEILWAKYCCAVVALLNVLAILIGASFLIWAMHEWRVTAYDLAFTPTAMFWVVVLIALFTYALALWILAREISLLQR